MEKIKKSQLKKIFIIASICIAGAFSLWIVYGKTTYSAKNIKTGFYWSDGLDKKTVSIVQGTKTFTFSKSTGTLLEWKEQVSDSNQIVNQKNYVDFTGDDFFKIFPLTEIPASLSFKSENQITSDIRFIDSNRIQLKFTESSLSSDFTTTKTYIFTKTKHTIEYQFESLYRRQPVSHQVCFRVNHQSYRSFLDKKWVGVSNQYVLFLFEPHDTFCQVAQNNLITTSASGIFFIGLKQSAFLALPEFINRTGMTEIYHHETILKKIFYPLIGLFTFLLNQYLAIIPSPGFFIVLTTLFLHILMSPIYISKLKAQIQLIAILPELKQIQAEMLTLDIQDKKYEQLQEKQLTLIGNSVWQKLLFIIQIPVFLAFFMVLSSSVVFYKSSFGPLLDLSAADSSHFLPLFFAIEMIILNIISFRWKNINWVELLVFLISQCGVPLVCGFFIFWNMPAGIVFYWICSLFFGFIWKKLLFISIKNSTKINTIDTANNQSTC